MVLAVKNRPLRQQRAADVWGGAGASGALVAPDQTLFQQVGLRRAAASRDTTIVVVSMCVTPLQGYDITPRAVLDRQDHRERRR
ncbi:hypothetical protein GCM10009759_74760 [Kitasatospora saccharophila]|uniref:Uncharacterized protein n=1 Tax=Kitasatospora saccharophila TaxID=407973 RepID=A0ABP5K012_9ACTN